MSGETQRDGIGKPLLAAGVAFALCAGGLAAWTMQAPLSSAVLATGRVAVEGESKTVQHLEGGVIAELAVAEGDSVEAGQVLVRLDVSDARATLAALTAERDAAMARSVRLRAELAGTEPDFAALASADATGLAAAIAGQRALYEARAEERRAQAGMLDAALARLAARSGAIRAELDGVGVQVGLTEEDADAARALTERGVLSRAALRDSERTLAGLNGSRASLQAQLAEAGAAEAETRLSQAELDTRRISAISEELATVTARLAEIEPAIEAAGQRLARADLRAPVDGVVVGLAVATLGGVIAPGAPVLDIVPQSATLVVQAEVQPADRERLEPGMTTEVRLPGLEGRGASSLVGTVAQISADRILASGDGEDATHYRMIVAFDGMPADVSLAPGMPVTVVVPTAPRTVIDYVLAPIRDAIARSMREV